MPKDKETNLYMPPGIYSPEEYETIKKQTLLHSFVKESNKIEGILDGPTLEEIGAHTKFLALRQPTVRDMEDFVGQVQPGAKLRDKAGMDVRVGDHRPPKGGPHVRAELEKILHELGFPLSHELAYNIHHMYETLHPFMDGNGRSGRVLWLWCMGGIENVRLPFLHVWYYQSLQFHREG